MPNMFADPKSRYYKRYLGDTYWMLRAHDRSNWAAEEVIATLGLIPDVLPEPTQDVHDHVELGGRRSAIPALDTYMNRPGNWRINEHWEHVMSGRLHYIGGIAWTDMSDLDEFDFDIHEV